MPSAAPQASARADAAVVRVRGTAIAPIRPFVEQYFGASAWPAFLAAASARARGVLDAPISSLEWYPFLATLDIVDALVKFGEGRPRTLRDFATYNLDSATNLIFRAIFKLGSPEFMVSRSDQVWKRFYSHGYMRCEVSPRHAVVSLFDFPYPNATYARLIGYSVEAVLAKAGAKGIRAQQTASTLLGDDHAQYRFDWQ